MNNIEKIYEIEIIPNDADLDQVRFFNMVVDDLNCARKEFDPRLSIVDLFFEGAEVHYELRLYRSDGLYKISVYKSDGERISLYVGINGREC